MEKSSNRRFGVRTVAAIVAGLMVGGMCTAMTASAADDSAAGYSATAPVNLTRPATVEHGRLDRRHRRMDAG